MSSSSPGPVGDDELLHRLLVSPRDYDPVTNMIAQKPFEKVFMNGLSVMRDLGTDQHFEQIAEDNLLSKPASPLRSVQAVCSTTAAELRGIQGEGNQSAFCIYDQTVPRNVVGMTPVPTHAGVMQRDIKFDVAGAKKANKDLSYLIFEKFQSAVQPASSFRENLFEDQNLKASAGHYVIGA